MGKLVNNYTIEDIINAAPGTYATTVILQSVLPLSEELRLALLDDIRFEDSCATFFKDYEKRNKYKMLPDMRSLIKMCQKERKRLIAEYEKTYAESPLKYLIKVRSRMNMKQALSIIDAIGETSYEFTAREGEFIESLMNSKYDGLTDKQAAWLQKIYDKAVEKLL